MPRYALHRYGTFRYGDYPLIGRRGKMEIAPGLRMRQVKSPVWTTNQKQEIEKETSKVRIRTDGAWVVGEHIELEALTRKVRVRMPGGQWVIGVVHRLEEEA